MVNSSRISVLTLVGCNLQHLQSVAYVYTFPWITYGLVIVGVPWDVPTLAGISKCLCYLLSVFNILFRD